MKEQATPIEKDEFLKVMGKAAAYFFEEVTQKHFEPFFKSKRRKTYRFADFHNAFTQAASNAAFSAYVELAGIATPKTQEPPERKD